MHLKDLSERRRTEEEEEEEEGIDRRKEEINLLFPTTGTRQRRKFQNIDKETKYKCSPRRSVFSSVSLNAVAA